MHTLLLIDLSSLAYPIWHMSQNEPNPNHTSERVVAKVHELAREEAHTAVCIDSGPSFRAKVDPDYKGNRPERNAPLQHQIALAADQLKKDGFPVWGCDTFEADDVIATATRRALFLEGDVDVQVRIVAVDKDIYQLVNDRVKVIDAKSGALVDTAAVMAKFGVAPTQMRDYLIIVGDVSDNIPGIKGMGGKTAERLLGKFTSLDRVYEELEAIGGPAMGLSAAGTKALIDFKPRLPVSKMLVALRDDAPVPFEEVLKPREAPALLDDEASPFEEPEFVTGTTTNMPPATTNWPQNDALPSLPTTNTPVQVTPPQTPSSPSRAMEVHQPPQYPDVLPPAPATWERGLEPRTLEDAKSLAHHMFISRMFNGYGNAQAVLSTIMMGRSLGIDAMTSLRTIHIIEGRHGMSAQLIMALCLKHPLCDYLRMVELTETSCTYVAKRVGNPEVKITHTLEMAVQAGLMKDNSNWKKTPQDMLMNRCGVRICRIVWPDVVTNVYDTEELRELKEAVR